MGNSLDCCKDNSNIDHENNSEVKLKRMKTASTSKNSNKLVSQQDLKWKKVILFSKKKTERNLLTVRNKTNSSKF